MLPWSFSEKAVMKKYIWPSCNTTCGVGAARSAVLTAITGGGRWVEIKTRTDPLYQHLIAERKFWRRVETGEGRQLHLKFQQLSG